LFNPAIDTESQKYRKEPFIWRIYMEGYIEVFLVGNLKKGQPDGRP
jgi:hypothetical protein